jgi:hypothetical protein
MIKGSCFCGGIVFEVGKVMFMRYCHCSRCRKESGTAFGTAAVAQTSEFRFVTGADLVKFYDYPPDGRRAHCSVCGSKAPLQLKFQNTHIFLIPAGLFDDDPGVRSMLHMFAGSKAPWWEIKDNLPQYEKWVPGYEPPWARGS